MGTAVLAAVLTGIFTLAGGLSGVLLTSKMNTQAQNTRQSAEDARRWLQDRRGIYAKFISITESLLREIDAVAVFMSYDGTERPNEDDLVSISEGSLGTMFKIDDGLATVLYEVQLMASSEVADLAERMWGALIEINGDVAEDKTFVDYYPAWFQARDLLQVLRNAMRHELGLEDLHLSAFPRDAVWPWLPDRPPREAYRNRQAILQGTKPQAASGAAAARALGELPAAEQ